MQPPERTEEFVGLFTLNARRIYGFILSLQPNVADADEIFQETSTVLWRKFEQFEPGTDFLAWACQIARYKVMSQRQRVGRERLQFSDEFVENVADESLLAGAALGPRHLALSQCIEKLHPRDRDLLSRRYQEGATTRSIAAEVGRSVDAIYKALNRIHENLFECIQRTLRAEGRP
ncbi:MAG: sigma-70 family RNA polymerase sigma factor [Pirellulales bacterium]|nr:sigma-70 family RNA polymerase sigma factor [Pirellulales bacterium]